MEKIRPRLLDVTVDGRFQEKPAEPFGANPTTRWSVEMSVDIANASTNRSLGYLFGFLVCSLAFKNQPEDFVDTSKALVQDAFSLDDARLYLQQKIGAVGEVPVSELSGCLSPFLDTSELDYEDD